MIILFYRITNSEESIYSTILPLHYVSKVFGLAPFTYVKQILTSGETRIELQTSRSATVYSSILCVVVFMSSLSSQINKLNNAFLHKSVTVNIPDILLFSSFSITSITSLILTLTINKDKIKSISATLYQVDTILFKNGNKYHRKAKRLLSLRLIVTFLVISMAMIFDCTVWTMKYGIKNISYLHYYLDMTIDWIIVLQFTNYVILIKDRLKTLHCKLFNLFRYENESVHVTSQNFEEHITLLLYKRKNSYTKGQVNNSTHKDVLRYNLTHDLLCDGAKLVISTYEIQIFLSIISSFMNMTIWIYFAICFLYDLEKIHDYDVIYLSLSNIFMSFLNLVKLFCITLVSYLANREIAKTVMVIRKLLLIRDMNKTILDELHSFSQQAALRQFNITVLGFLNLDFSLFCSIIGTILTYFVILMQFKISDDTSHQHLCCL